MNRFASVLVLTLAIGCGRATTPLDFPDPVDAGHDAEDGAVEAEAATCDPLTCEHPYLQLCGRLTNACGQSLECGKCSAPYVCGAQDLQDYSPSKNYCGLGCRVVAVDSTRCHYPSPIEHACPISNEFEALIRTDAFWNRYGCNPIRASKTELFFCCGL